MYEERTNNVNLTGIISSLPLRNRLLKGATITLVKFETPEFPVSQAITDNNGSYEFADVEPGKYSLNVSYNGVLEKPYNFHFWVTSENLTRLGQISFGMSQGSDNCPGDGTVMLSAEAIGPIFVLSPDLEIPFPLPFPPQPKSAYPRKKQKTRWRVFTNGKS